MQPSGLSLPPHQQIPRDTIAAFVAANQRARNLRQDAVIASGLVNPGSAQAHQRGVDLIVTARLATLDLNEPLIRDVLGRTGRLPQ